MFSRGWVADKVIPVTTDHLKAMFKKFLLLTCLLLSMSTGVFAQDKPTASRSLLARPPQSGPEPMLRLGPKNKPYTEMILHTLKLDYYNCEGIVAPWFHELLVAEMNYFAELAEMPLIKGDACVVAIGTDKSLTPRRISIHLFTNTNSVNACIRDETCPTFRSVSLIPKGQVLYRSYFLSDMNKKLISQQCVTDKGKLFPDTTCYTVP